MSETIILIRSQQTRDYGNGVQQTYSVEMTVSVETREDREQAFRNLNGVIAQEFGSFEAVFLPKKKPGGGDRDLVRWSGGRLVREIVDGNVRHKLKTGDFHKWGVPVYEEVIGEFPSFPEGSFEVDMTGFEGQIEMNGGKPKRVLTCRAQ